jgi:hypothetical protein
MATKFNVTYDVGKLATPREKQIIDVLIVTLRTLHVLIAKASNLAKQEELEEWGAQAAAKVLNAQMPDLDFKAVPEVN